jgi:hypothetical protein
MHTCLLSEVFHELMEQTLNERSEFMEQTLSERSELSDCPCKAVIVHAKQ